jgi:hypothetical protein
MSGSDLNKPPFEHVVLCASLGLFSEEHPVSAMAPEREAIGGQYQADG